MTALMPPKEEEWDPVWNGGPCRKVTWVDWVPEMFNDDAYIPVPNEILDVCNRCPVKDACLEWAMKNDAYGFWAGTSRYQRLQLGREQHRVKCPGCASDAVVVIDRNEVCMGCGLSWAV